MESLRKVRQTGVKVCLTKKKEERKHGRKTSAQVSQVCRALRLAGYCKKLSWCYTNLPIMILASKLACCVYDVYCSIQTMLFIYIATAATFFFIALDAAVTSFPQRTNTYFFVFF